MYGDTQLFLGLLAAAQIRQLPSEFWTERAKKGVRNDCVLYYIQSVSN